MRIVCSCSVHEVGTEAPDVLVLPERTSRKQISDAIKRWPNAVVIGATKDGRNIRGHLRKDGKDHINYKKFLSDTKSLGTYRPPKNQFFENDDIAIGVLICRDVENPEMLVVNLMRRLLASSAPLRLVCIPADMHSDWFPPHIPIKEFLGAFVALSNNQEDQSRRASFIADPNGQYLEPRKNHKAISYETDHWPGW